MTGAPRARPATVRARGWGWRHPTRLAWAVRDVDLDVAPGERVLLLGPSGSGKSTLLAGLAGLLDPATGEQRGELLVDGVPARRARALSVAGAAAPAGLLLQDPLAQTVLARAGDDVAFGLENHAVPPDEMGPRVADALRAVGFPYGPEHRTAQLSGGERQRLALAGVLALRPGLLLLDEPTAMLDPAGAALVRGSVARVLAATGATCVVVEHRVGPWLEHVDRVVVLDAAGGIAADGAPAAVLGTHGRTLAAQGVWVPGFAPVAGRARAAAVPGSADGARQGTASGTGGTTGTTEEPLLVATDLAVTRPQRARAGLPPVLAGLRVSVRPGDAICVTGPNGAGKSTLARVLGGLVAPAAGELRAGTGLRAGLREDRPFRWRSRELVTRIATVFQEPQHQMVAATVAEELTIGPRRAGVPAGEAARRADRLLARLRLGALARANPFTLSGGEQRRLSVGTALAAAPRLLVLDEPTFGQDARTWAELVDLLAELLDGGAAVVAATHDEALVDGLGARVLPVPVVPRVPVAPVPQGAGAP